MTTPLNPCLSIEVLSVDDDAATAEVKFLNPAHAGGPLTPHDVERPNPAYGVEEGAPPTVIETVYIDEDPNPHVIKTVRVPFTDEGAIDETAWRERLVDQALGVRARMTTAAPVAPPVPLADLVGPVV